MSDLFYSNVLSEIFEDSNRAILVHRKVGSQVSSYTASGQIVDNKLANCFNHARQ